MSAFVKIKKYGIETRKISQEAEGVFSVCSINSVYGRNDSEYQWDLHTEKSFPNIYKIKPKLDCTYHFPIYLEPKRRPFGSKSEYGINNLISV